VLGAGAIGGLWALRLVERGIAVTLLSRDAHAPRRLTLQDGERVLQHTFPQRESSDTGPVRALLVCTKAPATAAALAPLLPSLPAHTPVVLLQNGMGVDEWLCAARADLCVLTAITTDGVWRRDRDTLVLAGHGDTFLGAARTQDEATARAVAQTLGMTFAPDIRARRWRKLAVNCAINPLTVRYRCRNGELLAKPEALAAMREICAEVAAVMRTEGMAAEAEPLFRQVCSTAEQTAANFSSMYADADAGRDTEIRFLNGYVVAKAEQHGLSAPANAALLQEILALR
jgi:2-dehydropantoate 2-reductase